MQSSFASIVSTLHTGAAMMLLHFIPPNASSLFGFGRSQSSILPPPLQQCYRWRRDFCCLWLEFRQDRHKLVAFLWLSHVESSGPLLTFQTVSPFEGTCLGVGALKFHPTPSIDKLAVYLSERRHSFVSQKEAGSPIVRNLTPPLRVSPLPLPPEVFWKGQTALPARAHPAPVMLGWWVRHLFFPFATFHGTSFHCFSSLISTCISPFFNV